MKLLLLLLLPLCGMAFFSLDEIKEKLKGKADKMEKRFGKITKENKEKLAKSFGQDPEERKARLQKMFSKKLNRTLTEGQRQKLQERLAKIRPVKTEKPNENEPVDLFEVNSKEGVSEYLFQGDLLLTDAQLNEVELELAEVADPITRTKRQATTVYNKWAANTVYYYFDSSLSQRKKDSVAAAIDYLQSRTCVQFVLNATATNRIRVFNGAGCYSSIGMIGGQQDLSLGDGCEVIGTVAHEFTHALGIWHTQMRSDRDTYVTIDLSDVPAGSQGNFVKLSPSENTLYTPYEYGSFMHYGANAFTQTAGSLSIVPKDTRFAYTMGNRQISFYDIKMINDFYGCSASCPAATSAQCQNGGTPNPKNCATCNCPLGYSGTLCNQRPSGCGETLTATSAWQSKQFSFGNTTDNTNVRDTFTLCNYWITAPVGQKVQTKITYMWNSQCQYGCPFNGIEIKTDVNAQVTNPRFCCPEFNNQELTSDLNPTPIVAFNRYYYTTFTIEYRYIASTGPAPTTAAPAPPPTAASTTTTKAPVVSTNCANMNTEANCINNFNAGFCTMMPQYSFQTIKYNCGKTCGLCGKAADPCIDQHPQCADIKAAGMCSTLNPMEAEFHCAKTCGFCENPN